MNYQSAWNAGEAPALLGVLYGRIGQKPATTPSTTCYCREPSIDSVPRHVVFLHSLFFVLGFTIVFTLTGIAVGLFGNALNQQLLMQIALLCL